MFGSFGDAPAAQQPSEDVLQFPEVTVTGHRDPWALPMTLAALLALAWWLQRKGR